jgi:hypothetical protein
MVEREYSDYWKANQVEGERKKGRTRLRWMDSVKLDLLNMGIIRWGTETGNRWAVVTDTKAKLRGRSATEEEIKKFCSPHHPCRY